MRSPYFWLMAALIALLLIGLLLLITGYVTGAPPYPASVLL